MSLDLGNLETHLVSHLPGAQSAGSEFKQLLLRPGELSSWASRLALPALHEPLQVRQTPDRTSRELGHRRREIVSSAELRHTLPADAELLRELSHAEERLGLLIEVALEH